MGLDKQGPLTGHQQETYSQPNRYREEVSGKRADYVNAAAAKTNVGPREFGGEHPGGPQVMPPKPSNRGYEDKHDLLHYTENQHTDPRSRLPPPPRPPRGVVAEAIAGGDQAPDSYSEEPKGLPKRHPGPERLTRGKGVDGRGHDCDGRQIATSLVDEVIFGRANFRGQISLAQHGARTYGINPSNCEGSTGIMSDLADGAAASVEPVISE